MEGRKKRLRNAGKAGKVGKEGKEGRKAVKDWQDTKRKFPRGCARVHQLGQYLQ
jgi:hypothetical protein